MGHPLSGAHRTWLYHKPDRYGYVVRRWWEGSGHDRRKLHQVTEHRWVWTAAYGLVPSGYSVHHRDGNKRNNALSNLELLATADHVQLHAAQKDKGAAYRRERHNRYSREWYRRKVEAAGRQVRGYRRREG